MRVVRTNIIRKLLKTHLQKAFGLRPGRFPGIGGNAGNNGKDGKFHKSDQILDPTKRNINKLFGKNITSKNTKNKIFCGFRVVL